MPDILIFAFQRLDMRILVVDDLIKRFHIFHSKVELFLEAVDLVLILEHGHFVLLVRFLNFEVESDYFLFGV